MANFDFKNTPITKDVTLIAKWDCPPPIIPITLTCLTGGTAVFYNKWKEPVLFNGEEFPAEAYDMRTVQAGEVFEYTLSPDYPDAMKKWSTTMLRSPDPYLSWDPRAIVESDGAQFEVSVPDLTPFLEDDGHAPDNFFYYFCKGPDEWGMGWGWSGAVSKIADGSFDLSPIKSVGKNFFYHFAAGLRTPTLPAGSFALPETITDAPEGFFDYFMAGSRLTALPEGSFDTSHIKTGGRTFFNDFAYNAQYIYEFPAGSFRFDNLKTVGDWGFSEFLHYGTVRTLPEGSFNFDNLEEVGHSFCFRFGYSSQLTALPEGSFSLSKLRTVGGSFMSAFCSSHMPELPEGSFDTSKIEVAGGSFFNQFLYDSSIIKHLPAGSFRFDSLTEMGGASFEYFANCRDLEDLPAGSFNFPKLTAEKTGSGNYFHFFAGSQNTNTKLKEGNKGVSFVALHDITGFNVGDQINIPAGTTVYVGTPKEVEPPTGDGTLTDLQRAVDTGHPEDYYPLHTEFTDEFDGKEIKWIVEQYLDSSNNEAYGGAEGVILYRNNATPVGPMQFDEGLDASWRKSSIKKYLSTEYYDKSSDELKSVISELAVPVYDLEQAQIINDPSIFFFPSVTEVGFTSTWEPHGNKEGFFWDGFRMRDGYIINPHDNDAEWRKCGGGDPPVSQYAWLRTPQTRYGTYEGEYVQCTNINGNPFYRRANNTSTYVRPACFIKKGS